MYIEKQTQGSASLPALHRECREMKSLALGTSMHIFQVHDPVIPRDLGNLRVPRPSSMVQLPCHVFVHLVRQARLVYLGELQSRTHGEFARADFPARLIAASAFSADKLPRMPSGAAGADDLDLAGAQVTCVKEALDAVVRLHGDLEHMRDASHAPRWALALLALAIPLCDMKKIACAYSDEQLAALYARVDAWGAASDDAWFLRACVRNLVPQLIEGSEESFFARQTLFLPFADAAFCLEQQCSSSSVSASSALATTTTGTASAET